MMIRTVCNYCGKISYISIHDINSMCKGCKVGVLQPFNKGDLNIGRDTKSQKEKAGQLA